MPDLTIGRIAAAAGVGVETVRFYERKGLLARPRRPANGFRSYPHGVIARIAFIREAQQLGFSLAEIAELLDLQADPGADCARIRERTAKKLQDVQDRIRGLRRVERLLQRLVRACPGQGGLGDCSILTTIASVRRTCRPRRAIGRLRRGAPLQ